MNARLQARLLVAHIDRATPRRRGDPTLAESLSSQPCAWVASWRFLIPTAFIAATALLWRCGAI